MNFKEKTENGDRGESGEYEVEILYKSQNVRRRLEVSLRVLENKDEDGEFYVHQTIIKVKNKQQKPPVDIDIKIQNTKFFRI